MLLLSVFPGIDALGLAAEEVWPDACVVRGPGPIFGSLHDVRAFHPPARVFDGVFGGPPCQEFSRLRHINTHCGSRFGNLIPEFERCVLEADPAWFVMENVQDAPVPAVDGYRVWPRMLNNRWLGEQQNRERRFSIGLSVLRLGPTAFRDPWAYLEVALFEPAVGSFRPQAVVADGRAVPVKIGGSGKMKQTYAVTARHAARVPWVARSVTAGHGDPDDRGVYSLEDACELQGLPRDFLADAPFTKQGKLKAIANAVPLFMGRAVFGAVKRALEVAP